MSGSDTSQPVELIILPPDPQAVENGADAWLGVAAALLTFAVAAGYARVRGRHGDPAAGRLQRILSTAAFFAAAFTLLLVVEALVAPQGADLLASALFSALVFFGVGAVLFGIADFWLGLLRPRRTRRWLAAAILVFAAIAALCLAMSYWLAPPPLAALAPDLLKIVIVTAASGIIWWARLPTAAADIAEPFT